MIAKISMWIISGFLLGSIPFSLLLAKGLKGKDIRTVGDGNPGAYNAWSAGGWEIGVLAILMDVSKGFLPVFLAQKLTDFPAWSMILIALAPILGHIFSPFLHFHGGKAVAPTLGVWLGASGLTAIVAFALFVFISMIFISEHAWNVICGLTGNLVYQVVSQASLWLCLAAALNLLLLIWTHRQQLLQPVKLRTNGFTAILRRRNP